MVAQAVRAAGYRIVNIDSTVIAEEPRLQPRLPQMQQKLSTAAGLKLSDVSVKATSPEGLGALGQQAGIAAHAIALIEEA